LEYGSTEPLIRALPFCIWCVEISLDDGTRAAKIAAALRNDLLATITCGIQRRRRQRWPMTAALFCGVVIGLVVFETIHLWWG
jgi:hypothetical protein